MTDSKRSGNSSLASCGKSSPQLLKATMETSAKELKFAADRTLGKLAKWLRAMGQDVVYGQHLSGYGLIRAARAENRLILTRDRRLKQKQPPPFLFIESDHSR